MTRRVPFLSRVFEYFLIGEITGALMAKSGLTANLGQTKVLSYESPTGHFCLSNGACLCHLTSFPVVPLTGVLRADVNLSNFLLVTKMTRDDHAILGESHRALLANYEGLTVVGVGPHSNSRRSDWRHAARDNNRYCCGCFSSWII
jgi:hypothetical protein